MTIRFTAPSIMGDVKLRFDWRHLDDIEIVKKFNKKLKIYEFRLNGFHHDYYGRLENKGILELIGKKDLGNGAYEAQQVKINGQLMRGPKKTFFPKSWDCEMRTKKILESLQNITEVERQGAKFEFVGITRDGIKVRTIIQKNGLVTTSFPIAS